jgi:diguanylate cyclase (GGDEF)-like protein
MPFNSESIEILDSVLTPVLAASPVYNKEKRIVDFVIDYVNPVYRQMKSGFTRSGDKLSNFSEKLSGNVDWFTNAANVIEKNECFETTCYSESDNTWFHIKMKRTKSSRCVVTLSDINEQKHIESELNNLTYNDALTGIPNRSYFNQIFDTTVETAIQNKTAVGIMLIDIDDMKSVNDVSGHVAGDSVLRRSARILEKFQNETTQVFRLGDDEFLVLITMLPSRNRMVTITDVIFESFQDSGISISAGISICPDDNILSADLLKYADLAMHAVKKNGKNDIAFFERSMYETFLHHTLLQEKLLVASENNAFELYYQPQFNIETNTLRGFEALIRWHDDMFGWINPEEFIPIAEETHVIINLGKWVLETAAGTLKQWQQNNNFKGIMSVNVSPMQLTDVNFINDLQQLVKKYDIRPGTFEVEITEGICIDNINRSVKILNQIRSLGILVSLDDFGTGYSSFRYLQFLPLNTLKVDKAFVSNLDAQTSIESNITNSIISLVSKMGIDTIAEGVERKEQLDVLREMKCRNIQGFLRGKPMSKSRCDAILCGDFSLLLRTGDEPLESIGIRAEK